MQYKISVPIRIRYLELNKTSGITDFKLIVQPPSGGELTPVDMTEVDGQGIYEASFTPNATGWWWVRVKSVSKPLNIYSKSYYVGTTDDPNPSQEDGKISSVDTKLGEVQTTPTTNSLLGRLKDLWDKLNDLFTNGTAKLKFWDGTNQAGIDSANAQYVAGKSAVGVVPSSNPIYISGIDVGGLKRGVLTDSSGRLQFAATLQASALNIPVQLGMEKSFIAINNYEWQEILEYTVPTGYDFSCISFDGLSGTANEKIKAIYKASFGSFVCSTNTFTDGEEWILPKFASKLFVYVTTNIGSGSNDNITITYINQAGIIGRTGTVTITKNSLAGTRLEVNLQSGDYGIVDITNVTHSATGQDGAFNIEGNLQLFYLVLSSANTGYISPSPPLGAIVVPQHGKVYLQYQANTVGSSIRRINLTGSLVPR